MRVNKFLKKKVVELTTAFPEIKCSYLFDATCSTHYIEILPESIFKDSENLQCAQLDIYDLFDEKYPKESLVFISSNSLTKISNPSFVQRGQLYKQLEEKVLWFNELEENSSDLLGLIDFAGENNYALAA